MSDENQFDPRDDDQLRRLQARAGGMLPGIAAICMFMICMTIYVAGTALQGHWGPGRAKYSVLSICTLTAVGVFGLLRLKKWGWSIVTAACLMLSSALFYFFERTKAGLPLVYALLVLVFFLYLVRAAVRDRMR